MKRDAADRFTSCRRRLSRRSSRTRVFGGPGVEAIRIVGVIPDFFTEFGRAAKSAPRPTVRRTPTVHAVQCHVGGQISPRPRCDDRLWSATGGPGSIVSSWTTTFRILSLDPTREAQHTFGLFGRGGVLLACLGLSGLSACRWPTAQRKRLNFRKAMAQVLQTSRECSVAIRNLF